MTAVEILSIGGLRFMQDVFDYIADHGLAGALEGAHVAPLMRIDEGRAAALLVDRVAQVPPRVVVPALQASSQAIESDG